MSLPRIPVEGSVVLQLFRRFTLLSCHSWHLPFFTRCVMDVCPAEDDASPSSTDVEPASERRDLESPVTQQPETTDRVRQFMKLFTSSRHFFIPWPERLLIRWRVFFIFWHIVFIIGLSNPQTWKLMFTAYSSSYWSKQWSNCSTFDKDWQHSNLSIILVYYSLSYFDSFSHHFY